MLGWFCLALSACGGESEDQGGENTWTDPSSGLTWMNPTKSPRKEWDEAKQYCADLEFGGSTDWRLPSIYELRSLVRGCPFTQDGGTCNIDEGDCLAHSCWGDSCRCKQDSCGNNHCSEWDGPAAGGCYKPQEIQDECNGGGYWSSAAVEESGYTAWIINFSTGWVIPSYSNALGGNYVRCVR